MIRQRVTAAFISASRGSSTERLRVAQPFSGETAVVEHFSVDGTLIEAWASQRSFRPKDGSDGDVLLNLIDYNLVRIPKLVPV